MNTSTRCSQKGAQLGLLKGVVLFHDRFSWSEGRRASFTLVNIYAQGNLRSAWIYPTYYVREMFSVGYKKREEGACGGNRRRN